MKKCPFCAEEIQDNAVKCRHCGEFLTDEERRPTTKGQKRNIPRGMVECPYCHNIVTPQDQQATASGCLITIVLLLFFVIPGIIYMIWHSSKKQCPRCKMVL